MSVRRVLFFSPLLLGFTSIVSQILLLREMIVACYGNELSLGIMLSAWMLWVGWGSFLGGAWARRFPMGGQALSVASLLLAFILPASLLMIRSIRSWWGIGPGEVMALPTIVLLSLLLSLPLCLTLGLLFVFNARALTEGGVQPERYITLVYLWEAAGAFLGGLLSTFILLPRLSNLEIALLASLLNLLLCLYWRPGHGRVRPLLAGGCLLFCFLLSFLFHIPSHLDLLSWKWHWRGMSLWETADTIFGNIAVGEREGQISFYGNGLHLFSFPDLEAAEEAVHYALLQHPDPRSLFLIGGGVGGGLAQALKYPQLSIEYAELDPEVIALSRSYLPSEERALKDPRVRVHYGDGRLLLSRSQEHYDVIILNLPEPRTLQINRFYTEEFFRIVKARLSAGGVFSFRLPSSESYLSPGLARYLALTGNTLRAVFPEVVAFPGNTCIFFASPREGRILTDVTSLIQRLRERRLENVHVNELFLPFRLHPFKMTYLKEQLDNREAGINRDMEPISYLHESALWASQFGSGEKRAFAFLFHLDWRYVLLFFLAFLALLIALGTCCHSYLAGTILGSVFVTGLTSISLEIILLLTFQIHYGYVYQRIGLLLAAFMLGLSLGALYGRRLQATRRGLLILQASLMALCLLLYPFLKVSWVALAPPVWGNLLFSLLLLALGTMGGVQFCWANDLFIRHGAHLAWGTIYAVDLWGSALGALFFSALLIPRWGIPHSLLLIAGLNLMAILFLSLARRQAV